MIHQPHRGGAGRARVLSLSIHLALQRLFAVQPGGSHCAVRVGREVWPWGRASMGTRYPVGASPRRAWLPPFSPRRGYPAGLSR
jgi:hypothetical protein